jgi:endonuclease YncB( thermonuclease family)
MNHVYPVKAYEVQDGDTVKVMLDLGFCLYHTVSLRVIGVDAPEMRVASQKAAAAVVKRSVAEWLYRDNEPLICVSIAMDKYAGRIVGDLMYGPLSLSQWLLNKRLAKPYDGGTKGHWTDEELSAIESRAADFADVPTTLGTIA